MSGPVRILGVLNVTPDSFSDGGAYRDVAAAVAAGSALHRAGAHMVDVGGESTRPGAAPVPPDEELDRTIPVVEGLVAAGVPVSIDTRRAAVMEAAIKAGAAMVNDVSALAHDPDSLGVVARSAVLVTLGHMRGDPRTMRALAVYDDPVDDVMAELDARVRTAEAAGIARSRLILDPGIGFAKAAAHSLALLRGLGRLNALGLPLMVGASRKSLISDVAGPCPADQRLGGSIALALRAVEAGAAWVRVHDVAQTVQALALWQATRPEAA